ncbi:MAG: prepilin-type N-terminal cleavage/methylation domain-containing protein [Candidatus Acidiferrum sp.]
MREQALNTWLCKRKRQRSRPGARNWRNAGFTLIELMIVIAIILILLGMAAGNYNKAIRRSREAVLRNDLQELRKAIDNYTLDKQVPPQSVSDLFDQKYLHSVPIDPMTQQADWVPQFDSVVLSPDQNGTGMTDVHSASDQTSLEGTPYNTW